jgi:hypothetical protein
MLVRHEIDGLDLVEEFIAAGLGIALFPEDRPVGDQVRLLPPAVASVQQ